MLDWTDPRPLSSGPGRALATMICDLPGQAYLLVAGTLEQASDLAELPPTATAQQVQHALAGYLAGVAAAAMVADAATGRREWTGARDYAVHGAEVEFLRPEAVLLGTLLLALAAVKRAVALVPVWEALPEAPPVPAGHAEVVARIQQTLAEVTHARMTQVRERAEDVHG